MRILSLMLIALPVGTVRSANDEVAPADAAVAAATQPSAATGAPAAADNDADTSSTAELEGAAEAEDESRLTGNWFGLRPALEQRGITIDSSYTWDFFVNTRGGLGTSDSDTHRGDFSLSLSLDSEALGLWPGGTTYILFQNYRGESLTERHIGDLLYVNGNDAPARSQLSEFWHEQSLAEGFARVKLGKQDANVDFANNVYGGSFVNGAAFWIANAPMPTYPDPAMGAALFLEPARWLSLGAGIYDAEGSGTRGGFETAFSSPNDSFTIYELKLKPTWKLGSQTLPGIYRVGGWYHSGEWPVYFNDLQGRLPPRVRRGNSGVYLSFDQLLLKEHADDPADEQGLGMFLQFGGAPSDYNEISQAYGLGFQYVGLIPTRDADITGIGFFHAGLAGPVQLLEERYAESVLEWYYEIAITESLSIKPDLQYIFTPGGDGRDAFAAGFRLAVSF